MKAERQHYRSPMFYVGDKYKIIGEISQFFPTDIHRFIEPFTGGGSVFMNVSAHEYLLNDVDPYIVRLHQFLLESADDAESFYKDVYDKIVRFGLSRSYVEDIIPTELKAANKKSYIARFNKQAYMAMRQEFNDGDRSSMLELYLLLIFGFNRMLRFNRHGNFNLPVGNVDFNTNVKRALDGYFEVAKRYHIKWHNLDYVQFLSEVDFKKGDFIYLDPPYLITFSEYNKLWSESNEIELLSLLDNLNDRGVKFAISNVTHYKGRTNEIFTKWSHRYTSHPIKSNYISYHDNTIKQFNEVLITNY